MVTVNCNLQVLISLNMYLNIRYVKSQVYMSGKLLDVCQVKYYTYVLILYGIIPDIISTCILIRGGL